MTMPCRQFYFYEISDSINKLCENKITKRDLFNSIIFMCDNLSKEEMEQATAFLTRGDRAVDLEEGLTAYKKYEHVIKALGEL